MNRISSGTQIALVSHMKIKYFIPELGETINDAEDFDSDYNDLDFLAEDLTEHVYHTRDGWEWMAKKSSKISMVIDEKIINFEAIVEFLPSFMVYLKENLNDE